MLLSVRPYVGQSIVALVCHDEARLCHAVMQFGVDAFLSRVLIRRVRRAALLTTLGVVPNPELCMNLIRFAANRWGGKRIQPWFCGKFLFNNHIRQCTCLSGHQTLLTALVLLFGAK